ncbi:MAG TPA: TorF family putative porin [Gammaproteobacteria bacterium]
MIPRLALSLAVLVLALPRAQAQVAGPNVRGYVTLANDYFNRGLSQADGDGSVQLGIDYRHDSGFFAGGWAGNIEYAADEGRDGVRGHEVDYYVGYDRRVHDVRFTFTLSRYTYPGTHLDYDYGEVAGNVWFHDRVFLSVSYTDDLLGSGRSATHHEAGLAWPLAWNLELGASVGRVRFAYAPGGGYDHWNVGVSKLAGRFAVDLRYHDSDHPYVSYLGSGAGRWVLSISYSIQAPRT